LISRGEVYHLNGGEKTRIFNAFDARRVDMASEMEHYCPACEADRTFYKSASTIVHLGEKTKWYCDECDHQIVIINGIDSTATA
jgi:transposase-like protein